ncbi:trigger factor [Parvularcula dongshanensis]|uniref:Trigger factor n=1 Tax=Parvularcula dongshanensis TaxID=1173995 RepID=A0A840I081_9PROT|nr:trigger factor [Parvularcula dongshanensis]MBB4657578.1 trigger factor [Parvularcula dongshanensis]
MQVTQKSAEGLSREFHVSIPQSELEQKLNSKLEEIKGQVHLKGFRPGKAPVSFLKKMYGRNLMGELIQEEMQAAQEKAFSENEVKPAMAPHPHIHDGLIDKVVEGKADLEYDIHVEVLPEFEPADMSGLKLERMVAEVPEEEVEEQLQELAENNREYEETDRAAQDKDRVKIDFLGKLDGEPFEGGKGEDVDLVLGSGSFIPGFEDGLVGLSKGDEKTIEVTFPEEYGAENLAGKPATFDVTVKAVEAPKEVEINDEFAKQFGVDDLDALRERVRDRIKGRYDNQSRLHLKRSLLDALDEKHEFELPPSMVKAEFEQIWRQVEGAERDEEDKDKTEEELREEYQKIAERRVRLGLVLAEIGRQANVQVPQEDMNRALQMQAMQYGMPVQQLAQFYQQQPEMLAQLRAPIFEDKVVDHIIGQAEVTEKTVSKDELMEEPGA